MEVHIKRKKYQVFAYDVESHNDAETIAKQETSIWLSCFINEDSKANEESSYFYDIPSFLDHLEEMTRPKWKNRNKTPSNLLIYVFNLAFEWSFLAPYVLQRCGFEEKIQDQSECSFNTISNKSCASVWEVNLKLGAEHGLIKFRDLSKLFPGSLRSLAKSFGLPTQKGEIDYRLNRLHNHIVTEEEKIYCFKDCRIVIDILLKMKERNDTVFWKSLSAASYSTQTMINFGFSRSLKPMKQFRKYYPELSQEESDFLRKGVAGGITYPCPAYQFKDIKHTIAHIDLHQAHPSSAYNHYMPYGKGTYFKGKPPKSFNCVSCCRIKVSYYGVKLHSIIKLIGTDLIDDFEITVWSFEIPLMYECYLGLKVEYIDGYMYRKMQLPWRRYYKRNYDLRSQAKAKDDKFNIMYYKLLNNSSYGKLLERGHNIIFENIIRDDGVIDSIMHEAANEEVGGKFTYLPVGSCIPAWTRVTLVSAALRIGWDKIVYFDTDSIFFIKDDETMKAVKQLDFKDHLGGWGWEKDIIRGQFSAPKRYKTIEDDESLVVHMAGINFQDSDLDYDSLNIFDGDYRIQGVKRVKGGTIIIFKDKKLDIQPKYKDIYKRNKPI